MRYEILVNKDNLIPKNYSLNINLLNTTSILGSIIKVEEKTLENFLLLKRDLEDNDNIIIGIIDSYRSIEEQKKIHQEFKLRYGEDYTRRYVAKPRSSEHHTGLAVDIVLNINNKWIIDNDELMKQVDVFQKIHNRLHKYGFILRYPKEKEDITGYSYEPWHIRYVGIRLAIALHDNNKTLEEYYL